MVQLSNRRERSCRGSLVSKSAAIILVVESFAAILISVGIGLVLVPAGIIAAGVFLLVFGIAYERSRAQ
jgi:uncharacterized membrane protein